MTTPEIKEQLAGQDVDEVIDQIAVEKPWRGPMYGLVYFMRRWMVFLFTLDFCICTLQPWFITVPLASLTFFMDWFIAPRYATDLRLSDQEFVRKVCVDHVIEGPLSPAAARVMKKIVFVAAGVGLVYILICSLYLETKANFLSGDFENSGYIFASPTAAHVISFAIFIIYLLFVVVRSYSYPLIPFPSVEKIKTTDPFVPYYRIGTIKVEDVKRELFDYKPYVALWIESRLYFVITDVLIFILGSIFYINRLWKVSIYESVYIHYGIALCFCSFILSMCCLMSVYWKFDDIAWRYEELTANPQSGT